MKTSFFSRLFVIAFLLASANLPAWAQSEFGSAGKIWITDNYLYVSIPSQGVLMVDNSDPTNPQKLGFIEIPGNADIAVVGRTMYANSNEDLLTIDVSDPQNIREVGRMKSVFMHRQNNDGSNNQPIAWRTGSEMTDFLSSMIFSMQRSNPALRSGMNGMNFGLSGNGMPGLAQSAQPTNVGSSSGGQGGSMACFSVVDNYLYAIDRRDLHIFDLTDARNIRKTGATVNINTDIETVFPAGDRLFVGSQSGMYIYDIADRLLPKQVGHYRHTRSCDPVVVEGNYAYVTLRNGTDCSGNVNQLDVINITNERNPQKLKTYPMTNPHGLGIDNGTLFICDGRDGLKVFDAKDPNRISSNRLAHFPNIQTYDVIPDSNRKILIMAGGDKIIQYDYNNPREINKLSEFSVRGTL